MSVITQARPAAKLSITEAGTPHLFIARDNIYPAMLSVPGSSNLEMQLLNVSVTGKVNAHQPGTLQVILFASAGVLDRPQVSDPESWLPIGLSAQGAIGGENDLPNSSWMIRGENILYNLSNGKMQGTYRTNVADSQQPEVDFEHDLTNITNQDPVIVFAVGAIFTPQEAEPEATRRDPREADEPPVLVDLELSFFQLTD